MERRRPGRIKGEDRKSLLSFDLLSFRLQVKLFFLLGKESGIDGWRDETLPCSFAYVI